MIKKAAFHAVCILAAGIYMAACQSKNETPGASAPAKAPDYYTEKHRPQFHFSPERMWTNDPNGMVYHEGEYHLFYQHYPDSNVWGPMHWGHAVSKDLAHWEHLPIGLYPDSLGYIFSGSAVADPQNTSGFGKDGATPLVAMFTYHNMAAEKAGRKEVQSQGIAYSLDKGRTWTKYAGNPVIPAPGDQPDFRDPKVVWDGASGQWVVVLAVKDHIEFWGSKNLKNWTYLSSFGKDNGVHGGVWECPDLFQMAVDGGSEKKWVLIVNINPGAPNGGSGTQYFVGAFDGKNFTLDPAFAPYAGKEQAVWLDYGKDNYAGVTWSDIPETDGRRILIGWMSNWQYANKVPTRAWRNAMTLPRALTLKNTAAGPRIFTAVVSEIAALRGTAYRLEGTDLENTLDLTPRLGFSSTLSEAVLTFELPETQTGKVGVELSNSKGERYRIGYDAAAKQFFSDRTASGDHSFSADFARGPHTAPRVSSDRSLRLHLYFDTASAELIADDGSVVMTEIFFPTEDFNRLALFAEGAKIRLQKGEFYGLKSTWR